MDHRVKKIIFFGLLIVLPIFRLKDFGYGCARTSQYWLWSLGVLLLFALYQKNIWIKLFVSYNLGLFLYNNRFFPKIFTYGIIFNPSTVTIKYVDYVYKSIICFERFFCSFYYLLTLVVSVLAINIVQKMNTKFVKYCIICSTYIVFYFWIFNLFDNRWVAGAYLAFCIPLILTYTPYIYVNLSLAVIPIIGVLYAESIFAICAMGVGIISLLLYKKLYIMSGCICMILIGFGAVKFYTIHKNFRLNTLKREILFQSSFRLDTWIKSIKRVGYTSNGTGQGSYKEYEFYEGKKDHGGHLITHPHNFLIEIYCELGLIGFLLVIFFLCDLFFVKCPHEYKAMLLAIIFHCCGYYTYHIAMTGILIIICIAMINKYKEKNYGSVYT